MAKELYFRLMSATAASFITIGRLDHLDEAVKYAGSPARGEYRGFAALHDLCDANMLIPFANNVWPDNSDDYTTWSNEVMRIVTEQLIMLYDRWYA